jgi:hypothetical protein
MGKSPKSLKLQDGGQDTLALYHGSSSAAQRKKMVNHSYDHRIIKTAIEGTSKKKEKTQK